MPDLRQALKDFVATSNSGKYPDEKVLISKFPELRGYNINYMRKLDVTTERKIKVRFDELSKIRTFKESIT
jgi:hypothetical protein